jgi:hypothetical protein
MLNLKTGMIYGIGTINYFIISRFYCNIASKINQISLNST